MKEQVQKELNKHTDQLIRLIEFEELKDIERRAIAALIEIQLPDTAQHVNYCIELELEIAD